jgi:hypothetical protein
MTADETRAIQALQRRAERAAAQIMAAYEVTLPGVSYDLVVALLAVGWIEGRQAGGDEARQLIRDEMTRLAGLHSVKS